tara:strand:+ start:210 stop:1526 length:1317 start_codon:yes stop_codon:yes gene_type:complete
MLIRIDDYPNGVRSNSYWSGSSCGFNNDWQEHTFQLNLVLKEFEQRELPYILGVVPALLEERDIDYLKSLNYCEVALHGFDHGNVMFKQIAPLDGIGKLRHGGWTGTDNEFHSRYRKQKDQLVAEFVKGLDILKDFDVKHFIPPFNHMTQDAIDAVKDCGLTDIWQAGRYNYHDLIVHEIGHYDKSTHMSEKMSLDRNITFHLTWELEQFKRNINSWKLPKILDYIKNQTIADFTKEKDGRLKKLGTEYGGHSVDLNLIPEGSTVISAGVGEDISFDLELIKLKKCKIIAIDPTKKSKQYIEKHQPDNFTFINKALVSNHRSGQKIKMYVNKNPKHASDSQFSSHQAVSQKFYEADTITLNELFSKYKNISLVKLDIEGSEYEMIDDLIATNVQQMNIEFHDFCTGYSSQDTESAIKKIISSGYDHIDETFIRQAIDN